MQELTRGLTRQVTVAPKPVHFRILVCFAATGTLLGSLDFSRPLTGESWLQLGLALLLMVYIPVAYQLTRLYGAEKTPRAESRLSLVDFGLIGAAMALFNFAFLPALLLVIAIQCHAFTLGGKRQWFEANIALLAGVSLGCTVYHPKLAGSAELTISAVSLTAMLLYFFLYVYYLLEQLKSLRAENDKLLKAQRETNLASYTLSKYLPRRLWRTVTSGKISEIATERKLLTVFFSDIKDFNRLTEEMEAETLTRLLNYYLTEMSRIVAQYGGTIDKFIGDAIMVVFGDDQSKGPKSDALLCVTMALAMRKRVREIMQEWYREGISHHLQVRMGINTGHCTVGVFGTADHQTYTVMGTHVNLAARLESAAEPGEVLISHDTWAMIKQAVMCRDKGQIEVKGFSAPVKVYQVTDLRRNLGAQQTYIEEHAPGFSMHLEVNKIRNYDKEKLLHLLQKAAEQLKSKVIP